MISWTKDIIHYPIFQRYRVIVFPFIHTEQKYWNKVSRKSHFADKTANELANQTQALLHTLISVSTPNAVSAFEPDPSFTPVQNICLYMLAFGLRERPLEALQPLPTAKLCDFLNKVGVFTNEVVVRPGSIEAWDSRLRAILPINCPRNLPVSEWKSQGGQWLTSK